LGTAYYNRLALLVKQNRILR